MVSYKYIFIQSKHMKNIPNQKFVNCGIANHARMIIKYPVILIKVIVFVRLLDSSSLLHARCYPPFPLHHDPPLEEPYHTNWLISSIRSAGKFQLIYDVTFGAASKFIIEPDIVIFFEAFHDLIRHGYLSPSHFLLPVNVSSTSPTLILAFLLGTETIIVESFLKE